MSYPNYTMNLFQLWTFSSISIVPLAHLTRVKHNLSIFEKMAIFSKKKKKGLFTVHVFKYSAKKFHTWHVVVLSLTSVSS